MLVITFSCFCLLFTDGALAFGDRKTKEFQESLLLVSDLQERFDTSSVFLVYAGNDENLRVTSLMISLVRRFSSKSIFSMTMNYTQLSIYDTYYHNRITRPLYVVFLHNMEQVKRFQSVTPQYKMSYPFWLLVFTSNIPEVCNNPMINYFNVQFDTEMLVKCHRDPMIREWYSIDGEKVKIAPWALWDPKVGLNLFTELGLYSRRHNLEGQVLKIATVKESPFITAEQGPLSGYFAMLLEELSSVIHFTTNITYREENYGFYDNATGKYTGVIGRLQSGEIDMGVAEFTMTGKRLDTVDFTLPIMLSRTYLYLEKPETSGILWSYFKVYDIWSWIVSIAMFLLSLGIITTSQVMLKEKPISPNHISENILSIWGIYCQQGLTEFPTATPTRIAYFSVLATSVMLLSVYSACLVSYLTFKSPVKLFNNFGEFVRDGTYQLIAIQHSSDHALFTRTNDVVLMEMAKLMRPPEELPKTMMAGFRQVCERRVAFYATEAVKGQVSSRIACDLVFVESGRIDSLGLTLVKQSQYKGLIDYHLQKFRDVGIMTRLHSNVYRKVPSADNHFTPVTLNGILTLLLLLLIGFVVSIVILFIEKVVYREKPTEVNHKLVYTCNNHVAVTKNSIILINKCNI